MKKHLWTPALAAIAYNVLVDESSDNYEVFVMKPDGSEKRNITRLKGVDWSYYSYQDKRKSSQNRMRK